MDLYQLKSSNFDIPDAHKQLFYYDLGYKCFDCGKFSYNDAYHCKRCNVGCLSSKTYSHCQKCDRCHKISLLSEYCTTCKKCTYQHLGRCTECPLICGECGQSQPFDQTLKHCPQCRACYYRDKLKHCAICEECVEPYMSHCVQCGKCQLSGHKHCSKCDNGLVQYNPLASRDECDRCFKIHHCTVCRKRSVYNHIHHQCKICGCLNINYNTPYNTQYIHCQDCNKCHSVDMIYCQDCQQCNDKTYRHIKRVGRCIPLDHYDLEGYKISHISEKEED